MQTILFRNLIRRLCSRRELIIFLSWNTFSLNQKKFAVGFFMVLDLLRMQFFFSQPRSNTSTFSTFSIQDSRPHLLTFSMFIMLSREGEGGTGQWVKCCILGCLFVSVFICEKTGRRSWARRWMGSLCPETNKQWSESQHTHTHTRRAWVGHLDARWTLTWKEKQGEACYRRTHLHTHTHAHAGHRCPSLAHAVASEVAHDLGLVVSNQKSAADNPEVQQKQQQNPVFPPRWLLQHDSRLLLLGNAFYWQHESLRFTNPKSETRITVTPACKHVPPLRPFSRHWAKPHASLTNLLFGVAFWSSHPFSLPVSEAPLTPLHSALNGGKPQEN